MSLPTFLLRFSQPSDFTAEAFESMVSPLALAQAQTRVGFVFSVDEGVTELPKEILPVWLAFTAKFAHRIEALAVVAISAPVRRTLKGFQLAESVATPRLRVNVFATQQAALTWVENAEQRDLASPEIPVAA